MLFENIYYWGIVIGFLGDEERREATKIWKMSKIISCLRFEVILHLRVLFSKLCFCGVVLAL